jgi:L-asparaginase
MTTENITDNATVAVLPLEKDDRVGELQSYFVEGLTQGGSYAKLTDDKKQQVSSVLQQLKSMRFDDRVSFSSVAKSLLEGVDSGLTRYIDIALDSATECLPNIKGVLVIYTGGTIGSAPKDPADPDSPQIVMPWNNLKNAAPRLNGFGYPVDAVSFAQPLDSCNVGPEHWRTMAHIIKQHYDQYAGFIILHGTDSMVYTASSMAFMLQELSKPVVVTGSQVGGIVNPRNDAHQNMVTAIMLANAERHNLPIIPEVVIAFGNRILRGCRAKKMNVISYQGFDTANYPHLGGCGDHIAIERKQIRAPSELGLQVFDQMNTHVITLEVFPGMQHSTVLGNILKDENLKGVVVKAYGAGNIPTDPTFLDLFKAFVDRGGVVVVTTSVPTGHVEMGLYETSQVLLDRGLIGCFDITSEAALCKLMMLLGTYPDDPQTVTRIMQQSIVGEQSLTLESTAFNEVGQLVGNETTTIKSNELLSSDDEDLIDSVILRFKNARLTPVTDGQATIVLQLNGSQSLGEFKRKAVHQQALVTDEGAGESLALDLTKHKALFISKATSGRLGAKQAISFDISLQESDASFAWDEAELNIYIRD